MLPRLGAYAPRLGAYATISSIIYRLIWAFILGRHLYPTFTVCLLKYFLSLCLGGKCLSKISKNSCPIFVFTSADHGGLNQIAFLCLCFFFFFCFSFSSYFNMFVYPLFCSASWYSFFALSNCSLLLEIVFNLLLTDFGICFFIMFGWFESCMSK